MNSDAVFALVDRIYAAAVDAERWQDFLAGLSEAFGGAAAGLALELVDSVHPARYHRVNLSGELDLVYQRHFLRGLPWGDSDAAVCSDHFARMGEVCSEEEVANSDLYREWMQPQGLAPEAPVRHDIAVEAGRPVAAIALYRRVGGRAFSDDDLRGADQLVPHLARAFRCYRRFGGARHERQALAEVMNRLPVGVMLLDRDRRPVVSNRSANRIIALDDGLSLTDGSFRAANRRDHAVLCGLLDEAIAKTGNGTSCDRVMTAARPSGRRAFPIIVAPLLEGEPGAAAEDAVASILIGDPDEGQSITPEIFRSGYDLTPAEAELVKLLADGYSLEDAAQQRGVTLNTVRTQLKRVFAKTDTNRQGDLIRLVLTGAATFED
jgi:DNA-binding CsgD family transcriptional regulator